MWFDQFATPIGQLTVAVDASGVRHVLFDTGKGRLAADSDWQRDRDATREAREQLLEYFAGERRQFSLPLAAVGTPFQQRLWLALADIPFGTLCSYAELAGRLGCPRALRAVGAAAGRNPLPILLPCHRVVGSDGSLTGFSAGLPRKQWLLAHEGVRTVALL